MISTFKPSFRRHALCSLRSALLALCAMPSALCALDPQTCTVTNVRNEAVAYASHYEFFRNQTLLLTNCIACTTSSSAAQDLTGLYLRLTIGDSASNVTFNASAMVATSGTWWCSFNLPTNWTEPYLQLKLTNSTTTYTYPWKILKTKAAL